MPDAEANHQLIRAQRDIDTGSGLWKIYDDTGLKFFTLGVGVDALVLDALQLRSVREATCAQAEYRMTTGNDFMVKDQYAQESGPDYSSSGKLRKLAGEAYTLLHRAGLLRLGGQSAGRRRLWSDDRYRGGLPNDV